jgi:hypothetical protein
VNAAGAIWLIASISAVIWLGKRHDQKGPRREPHTWDRTNGG